MFVQSFKNFGVMCLSEHNSDSLSGHCSRCDYFWRENLLATVLDQVSKELQLHNYSYLSYSRFDEFYRIEESFVISTSFIIGILLLLTLVYLFALIGNVFLFSSTIFWTKSYQSIL